MKKKVLAGIMLAAGMLLGSMSISAAEAAEETKKEIEKDEEKDPLYEDEEGYVLEGDGYYASVMWTKNGDNDIFGRMYYPEDFDESKKYTTVVLNHGGNVNADYWNKAYAPELAKNGYVCYAFDCRSCTEGGRGSYSTPTEKGIATVETYSEDLNGAIDMVQSLPYVDTEKLYLFGQSMGGATVQNVAAQRSEEIAGVVVLYGSLGDDNSSMVADYENLKENPYAGGEVLFIQGTEDANLPVERTLENMTWYEDTSFVLINKAYHGFGVTLDRPAQICIDNVIDFIQRTSEDTEE